MGVILEVCVADAGSLAAAIEGGADRIELCSALELGGLTPGPGLMALAARAPVPVYALVRPRSGDFVFDAADAEAMLADIAAVRTAGLAGVVLGASLPDGRLDGPLLDRLAAAAHGLGRTLHRAFDLVPAIAPAVDLAVDLGFERILTSGRAPRAVDGIADLAAALDAARGRIAVMAGAGLDPAAAGRLLSALPLRELHGSCSEAADAPSPAAVALGFAAPTRRHTTADAVRRLRRAIDAADRVATDAGSRQGAAPE